MTTAIETFRRAESGRLGFLKNPGCKEKTVSTFPYAFPLNGTPIEIAVWEKTYRVWWENTYAPFIPAEWLKTSKKIPFEDQELTPKQKEAILTHPDEANAIGLAFNQKLSSRELALVFVHPKLSSTKIFNLKLRNRYGTSPLFLIEMQKGFYMKDEEIEAAQQTAKSIIAERKNNELISKNDRLNEIKYSRHDIMEEIKIPQEIDEKTSAALGIMYGTGFIDGKYFKLSCPNANLTILRKSIETMHEVFNFPLKDPYFCLSRNQKGEGFWIIQYRSIALTSWLAKYIKFPPSREVKRNIGIPQLIKASVESVQNEFLKYCLAFGLRFYPKSGRMEFHSVSGPFLEDIETLIHERILRKSTMIVKTGTSFALRISTIPMGELFLLGYFDENDELRSKIKDYFKHNWSPQTRNHLRNNYPRELFETKFPRFEPQVNDTR